MNKFRGCDDPPPAHAGNFGKRKLGEGEPKQPSRSQRSIPEGVVDRFGVVNVLSTDKFGALRSLEESGDDVYDTSEEHSTGSCTPVEYNTQRRKHEHTRADPAWRLTSPGGLENQGASSCPSDPGSNSSIPISCTLHESRTPTRSDAGAPVKRFWPPPLDKHPQNVHVQPDSLSQNELLNLRRAEHNEREHRVSARLLPGTKPRHSVDPTRIASLPVNVDRNTTLALAAMDSSESSESTRYSGDFNDGPNRLRINYKFASAGLEASLLERMEARQQLQDRTHEPERCSHVISPEDLVWGSVKSYVGMVLDRETNSLLGTAVLFMPPEPRQGSAQAAVSKSAWVTCVQVVEGRTEVLIKNHRGSIHVAQLMLTSTALGLALFSVNMWQGTFALAFLSRVTGPASLPHRPFVDVDRSDRVYVIGYEEPWESESAAVADARVRPGRIIDAGRHTIVETDFTTGRLGGSIDSAAGFRGGLVVRADGLLAGVVTGELLFSHRTKIDFTSAYNVYALLEEL